MPTQIQIDESPPAPATEKEIILGRTPLDPHATTHCWSCFIHFRDSDTRHEHPLLGIVVCSVCCDGAECAERTVLETDDRSNDTNNNDDDDDDSSLHCSFCSLPSSELNPPHPPLLDNDSNDASNDLFLCDSCPRAYCRKCVCVTNGGDMEMVRRVEEKEVWSCCYCRPTHFLEELRRGYAMLLEEEDGGVNNNESCNGDDNDDVIMEQEKCMARTIDELYQVESKYTEAQCHLEDESMNLKRIEIESELKDQHYEEKDLEAAVSEEMEKYQSLWERNAERLQETIGKLLNELEDGGVNVGDVYKFWEEEEEKMKEESEPDWKREADQALDERDVKEGFGKGEFRGATGYKAKDTRIYKLEPEDLNPSSLKEIEDINTTLGAIDQMNRLKSHEERANQWGSKTGITEEDIEMFQKKCTKFEEITLGEKIDLGALEKNYIKDADDEVRVRNEGSTMVVRRKNGNGPRVVRRTATVQSTKMQDDKETFSAMLSGYSKEYVPYIPNPKNGVGASTKAKKRAKLVSVSPSLSAHEFPGMKGMLVGKDVPFVDSDIILPVMNCSAKITVCKPLASLLKRHQIEGVKFCWKIMFENLCQSSAEENVRGAILAHSMGVGKSIQTITIIHTLLTHPSLVRSPASMNGSSASGRLVQRVLLITPVNTLANWKAEFNKWIDQHDLPFVRFLLWEKLIGTQKLKLIKEWHQYGGVLCCSGATYAGTVKKFNESKENNEQAFANEALLSPDVVVLDEAHTMLKSSSTVTFTTLNDIQTKLRLCLTGTPLQNRLLEYYRMANWTSPGCLGSEARFTNKYVKPIMAGMATDCTPAEADIHEKLSTELHRSLSSFVHRCSSNVLKQTLPFMQESIIHIRQSKSQTKLYREFNKYKKEHNAGFLEQYHALRPVMNHPACLPFCRFNVSRASSPASEEENDIKKLRAPKDHKWTCDKCEAEFDTFEEAEEHEAACKVSDDGCSSKNSKNWWDSFHAKIMRGNLNINSIEHGGKIVALLQILAHCDKIGDKVVVFSNAISTLDFIEECLQSPTWNGFTPQLPDGEYKVRGWTRDCEYSRIDGGVDATQRGQLISSFNTAKQSKLFLVSIKAGGLGVNLVAANRVVLFDADWNPAVVNQAIHRCYRYGQTKPVFIYQLLAEGSMEEKIYTRAATKKSLASLIVDEKNIERMFSRREMDLLQENDTWVSCEACNQWRMLPPDVPDDEVANLPEKWYCKDNIYDPDRSFCSAPEQSSSWYAHHWENRWKESQELTPFVAPRRNDDMFEQFSRRDVVLRALLERCEGSSTASGKQINSWISKYSFSKETIQDAEDADAKRIALSTAETASPKKKNLTTLPLRTSPRKASASSPKTNDSAQKKDNSTTQSRTSPCLGKIPRKKLSSNQVMDGMKENRLNLSSAKNKLVVNQEQITDKMATGSVEKKRKSPDCLLGKKKSSKPNSNSKPMPTQGVETIDLLDSDSD